MACECDRRRFIRSLAEDDVGLPGSAEQLAATKEALLGRCRTCGAWWERLPHEVYGWAWYQTEQRYWDPADVQRAAAAWSQSRRDQGC